jgi:hypothetical protein
MKITNNSHIQKIILAAILLVEIGCAKGDKSLIIKNSFGKVQNGSAFEKTSILALSDTLLIIPMNAIAEPNDTRDSIKLFIAKTISFGGHPPREIGIQACRNYFGAALKREKQILKIATFGEWDSRIEGAAWINMIITYPTRMKIERRTNLSGDSSESINDSKANFTGRLNGDGPYWYSSTECAAGWQKIHELPDYEQTAKRALKLPE